MAELIVSMHPKARCEVIPSAAEDSLYELPIRSGEFMLYLGRVDMEQKGIDLLLAAFALVPPEERARLVMAGHGFEWDAVRKKIAECGLESWVDIRGRVDSAERARLLTTCRLTCVPSREETFGIVILESCAAGKPVVLFDKAPMNEVAARDACEIVPAYDVAAYAEALRRLLRLDAAELERRGAACRAWAGGFRWGEIARRQEAYYDRVVSTGRAS
jgi:glycosyltransferase involved in cell wall biosynthesis